MSYLFLVVSLIGHLVLFLWLPVTGPVEKGVSPVVVELVLGSGSGNLGKKGNSKNIAGDLSLTDLGIKWTRMGKFAVPTVVIEDGVTGGGDGFGGAGHLLGHLKNSVAYDRIYYLIDHALYYPSEFKKAKIEGVVKVKLVFSPKGVLLKRRSYVKGVSRYLQVFIWRILRKVFADPLPIHLGANNKPIQLNCVFDFALVRKQAIFNGSPDVFSGDPSRSGVMVDHLSFYRSAKVFGQWQLGPFSGYALVPSVGFDVMWLVKKVGEGITQLTSNKAKIDPLQKYRDDPKW